MARETVILWRYTMEIQSLKTPLTPQIQSQVFPSTMRGYGHQGNSPACSQAGLECVTFKKNCFENTMWKNKIKYVCGLLCNDSSNGWPDILRLSEPFPNYVIISMVSSGEPGRVTHDAFPESLKTYTTWRLLTLPTCHGSPHGTMLIATKINK